MTTPSNDQGEAVDRAFREALRAALRDAQQLTVECRKRGAGIAATAAGLASSAGLLAGLARFLHR